MKIGNGFAVLVVGSLAVACGGGGGESAKSAADATNTTGATGKPDSASVPGGSLAEQEAWSRLNEEMAGFIKETNAACGSSIQGSYDVASYKGKFKDGVSYGVSVYARASCQGHIQAVRSLCTSSESGKARVKARIQKIECKYGTAGQKPNVSLSGGTLVGQFDPDAGGAALSDATADWLKKSL